MPTHTKKPPNAPCLSPTPSGSHTMPQGGSAGPNMIDLANGQPAPSEAATRRRAAACPRRRRADRDAAFLVKTTYCCSTPAAIASRGARQAETASTNGTRDSPRRFVSTPPRARTGHPIPATCEARDRRAARADRAGIRLRTHPSETAACGARLPRAGGEPWLNFIV